MTPEEHRLANGILYTDQYQLTMAQFYYRMGMHEKQVQFEYFFRKYPDYGSHQAGYCIFAGLEWLLEWMRNSRFTDLELKAMRGKINSAGRPFYDRDFLDWLRKYGTFESLSIRTMPEGRIMHPEVPVAVVQGPMIMAQLLETSLLNHLNYQSLIATRASRIRQAGQGRLLLEFGMRRGQDRGSNAGARAAMIGGADFTSNVGISHVLGYPPKGTHAHSMVQACMALGQTELEAFRAFAEIYPDDCILLVDTMNTLESGIPNAIKVFEELRRKGHKPMGVRLDSGDLAHLSLMSNIMLVKAGFPEPLLVLSNKLDEMVITQIINQINEEAPLYNVDPGDVVRRLCFGVGTRLITSSGRPALDGVYKLTAIKNGNTWQPAIKISETPSKTINPGFKKVWRLYDQRGNADADLICLEDETPEREEEIHLQHPVRARSYRRRKKEDISSMEELLQDVYHEGKVLEPYATMEDMRRVRDQDLSVLDPGVKRLINPHIYHVSLSKRLWDMKQEMVNAAKK